MKYLNILGEPIYQVTSLDILYTIPSLIQVIHLSRISCDTLKFIRNKIDCSCKKECV